MMLRLKKDPILLCFFTDQGLNWEKRQGLDFKAADGSTFKGYGFLFSAHDGRTQQLPHRPPDGRIQLLSSRNHDVFNLAWLKDLPTVVKR